MASYEPTYATTGGSLETYKIVTDVQLLLMFEVLGGSNRKRVHLSMMEMFSGAGVETVG